MAKTLRAALLVHPQFNPQKNGRVGSATEFDVWKALKAIGHTVEILPAQSDLRALDRHLAAFKPDVVFNLLEEFRGEGVFDFHVVTFLESLGIAYTGCSPRGLIVTRNKLWTSHIARGEGVATPDSTMARGQSVAAEGYPLLVKYNREHASLGMTQANVVRDRGQLTKRLARLKDVYAGEVIVQRFIPGLEISVAVMGNARPEAFEPWRLRLPSPDAIATAKVKFSARYRQKKGIRATRTSGMDPLLKRRLKDEARRLYGLFDMNGYARFDFRVDRQGTPFLIDVNANPCLAKSEDFASAARAEGIEYPELIQKIVQLGLGYKPRC